MNKIRQTSHLFLLLSAIAIFGTVSFSAGQILQQGTAQVAKPNAAGVANQTSGNIPYLPPGLMKSIIEQARNTNATKFALQHAINATTAALMNKTAGINATSAAGMNATSAAGINATSAAGINATSAAGMNATSAAGMNATSAAGMNKTAGINAVLNLVRNTNATSFAAHNIINATKTGSKH
jgi:hypothetical protein